MDEIEIKLRIADPAAVNARLSALAGAPDCTFEINEIFDTGDARLRSAGCALRLRAQWPVERNAALPAGRSAGPTVFEESARKSPDSAVVSVLTFKGPATSAVVRAREEIETTVGSPAALRAILERLGFTLRVVYEKRRATWRLGGCEVVLDQLPQVGWFAEIEGPDESTIQEVRTSTGLADCPPAGESYVALAARYGVGDPCRRLCF